MTVGINQNLAARNNLAFGGAKKIEKPSPKQVAIGAVAVGATGVAGVVLHKRSAAKQVKNIETFIKEKVLPAVKGHEGGMLKEIATAIRNPEIATNKPVIDGIQSMAKDAGVKIKTKSKAFAKALNNVVGEVISKTNKPITDPSKLLK